MTQTLPVCVRQVMMLKSRVAVLKVKPKTILNDIQRLCDLAGLKDALTATAPTMLLDSVAWHYPFPAANTTPWQLEGAILALQRQGLSDLACVQNKTSVAEALHRDDLNNYLPILKRHQIPVLSSHKRSDMKWLEHRPRAKLHVLHEVFRDGIFVPDYFFDRNVVLLPTMKCHVYTTTGGALLNAFSSMLGPKGIYATSWIHRALVDVLAIQKELGCGQFAIMDGTTAGDGPGPRTTIPVVKDYMLASRDPVALDAVAAKMMGFDPSTIEHLVLAQRDGLGVSNPVEIELVGDDISREKWGFTVGSNVSSRIGDALWFGPLKPFQKAFLQTPVANVLAAGNDLYFDYYRWRHKDRAVFEQWKHGTQWGELFSAYERGESDRSLDPPNGAKQ